MPRTATIATLAGLTLLTGALVTRARTVPAPVPDSAPPAEFSSARALRHLRVIAQRPHPSGSEDHARVRAYVIAQLSALGLEPQVQEATAVGTRYPTSGFVRNVMARLPGKVPGGKAVLISVHYDGVGASPAASDDGAGSAALLETLRALRAAGPLEHDVIALFTDGEEPGLLGAAAFVREHPWAKDVEVTLDFEARGTDGRAFMFETGAGNLDAARVLATLPDVTAGSLLVTVYRLLPNDTDLSELSKLNKPALNFAFVHGVERYHTAHDDVAHLSPGTLQHHGNQMLALARAFGNGPLPRPVTGDAIFFDAPVLGVVVYPEGWGLPIAIVVAIVALALVARTARREPKPALGIGLGVAGMLVATGLAAFLLPKVAAGIVALHTTMGWDGAPAWRAVYALALGLLALSVAAASWALTRRWATAPALHAGALLAWTLLVLLTAIRLPGASYLFTWPVLAVAIAAWIDRGDGSRWTRASIAVATLVAGALLIPVIYTVGGYTLPLDSLGGMAVGALVPTLAWLLAPQLEALAGGRRWVSAGALAAASVVFVVAGLATIRRNGDHPTAENLTYVTSADADSAWLTAPAASLRPGSFTAAALGASPRILPVLASTDSSMRWVHAALGGTSSRAVRGTPRTIGDWPDAAVVGDSVTGDKRRLTVHFSAPRGTLGYRVGGESFVRVVAVDGRAIDTTRYRFQPRGLSFPFAAPPEAGFTLVLELPRDSAAVLRLNAMSAGLPPVSGEAIPARPAGVVAIQNGDVTVRHRRVTLTRRP